MYSVSGLNDSEPDSSATVNIVARCDPHRSPNPEAKRGFRRNPSEARVHSQNYTILL